MTTTDFNEWMSSVDLNNYESVYSLHRSVSECETYGSFSTKLAKGSVSSWIISDSISEESLILGSVKAKFAFLEFLREKFCGELSMEGWYTMKMSNAKND